MVSRKVIHQQKQQNKNKHLFKENVKEYFKLAVLSFLVILFFLILPINYSQAHYEAQEALMQVYQDQEWVYLEQQVDERDIDRAQKTVDQAFESYPTFRKTTYNRALDQAHQKLEVERQFKELLANQATSTEPDLFLKDNISEEKLSTLKTKISDLPEDSLRQEQEITLGKIEDIFTRIQAVKETLDLLPEEMQEVSQINQVADQVLLVEEELGRLENHAEITSLYKQLKQKTTRLSQHIQSIATEDNVDQINSQKLFQSQSFNNLLDGTMVDRRKLIALTFDDGPNPEYTQEVLAVLDKHQVKGTFFLMGQYVESYPEIAQEIVEKGHLIGNHSYDHPNYELLSDEEVLEDFGKTQDIIEQATQIQPQLYRTPYGGGGARVVRLLEGSTSVIWNLDSEDWQSRDSETIFNKVMSEIQPKTLLLMHDSHDATAPALELIIPALKEEGYSFVEPLEIGYEYLFFE